MKETDADHLYGRSDYSGKETGGIPKHILQSTSICSGKKHKLRLHGIHYIFAPQSKIAVLSSARNECIKSTPP